jgi:hypothetical protein
MAVRVTIRKRIEQSLLDEPGQTASDLAAVLFDDRRASSRLQFPLSVLLSRGRVWREGNGGLRDAHRYFLPIDRGCVVESKPKLTTVG